VIRPFKGGLGSIPENYHLAILARRAKSIDRATEAWRWIPEALSLGLLGSFGSVALVRYYAIFGGSGNQSCVLSCDVTQYQIVHQNFPSLDTFRSNWCAKLWVNQQPIFTEIRSEQLTDRKTNSQTDCLTKKTIALPQSYRNKKPAILENLLDRIPLSLYCEWRRYVSDRFSMIGASLKTHTVTHERHDKQ